MATIRSMGFLRHMRADPNQYILHFRKGKLAREGVGLSYWFFPLTASIAQLPVEDCETTFLHSERSRDLQEVTVQVTLRYRIAEPELAASRFNFGISLDTGRWLEEPLERLSSFWSQRAQGPTRTAIAQVELTEAIRSGAERIQAGILASLEADEEIRRMGLAVVDVRVTNVAPSTELERALQTPTREALQQKADEAVFRRRADAVENERAIKENELATEIELARRQEELIEHEGANRLLEVGKDNEAQRLQNEAAIELRDLVAAARSRQTKVRAEGDAEAIRLKAEARAAGESKRADAWRDVPARVLFGLAMAEFAGKIGNIQHLNITPNMVGQAVEQFFMDGDKS